MCNPAKLRSDSQCDILLAMRQPKILTAAVLAAVILAGCGDETRFDYPYELVYHSAGQAPRRSLELWSNYLYLRYEYPRFFTGETYHYTNRTDDGFSFSTTQPVNAVFRKTKLRSTSCRWYKELQMYDLEITYGNSGTSETYAGEFRCDSR